MGYMLDTNIFNDVLDGNVDLSMLGASLDLFVTHVQLDEIEAASDDERRSELLRVFTGIPQEQVATESFVFDVSRWGRAKWSNGELYTRIRERLNQLGGRKQSNAEDATIADTAIKLGLTLVTHDRHLFKAVTDLGGAACNLEHLLTTEADSQYGSSARRPQ